MSNSEFNHVYTLRINDRQDDFLQKKSEKMNISVQNVIRLSISRMMDEDDAPILFNKKVYLIDGEHDGMEILMNFPDVDGFFRKGDTINYFCQRKDGWNDLLPDALDKTAPAGIHPIECSGKEGFNTNDIKTTMIAFLGMSYAEDAGTKFYILSNDSSYDDFIKLAKDCYHSPEKDSSIDITRIDMDKACELRQKAYGLHQAREMGYEYNI